MARKGSTRLRGAIAAAAIIGAVVGGLGATPAHADPTPTVSVLPATDLLDRNPVQASAAGLTPGATYVFTQCGVAPGQGCARDFMLESGPVIRVRNAAQVKADVNGTAYAELRLERDLRIDGVPTYDCAAGGCVVALLDTSYTPLDAAPITFTAEGTYRWPGPTELTASPTAGLVEGQSIDLSATGLDPRYAPLPPVHSPSPAAWIDACRAVEDPGPDDCLDGDEAQDWAMDPIHYLRTEPDGTAEGTFAVHRFLPLPGGTVDCAVEACTVAVTQGDNPVTNRVPLSFGPEWAPFTSAGLFVDALGDLRGRPYTSQERSATIAALTSRQTFGADALADAALDGTTATGSTRHLAEATRLYRAYFGRPPEAAGLLYWSGRMAGGLTSAEVGRLFGGTPEFRATYGTSSNAAVVDEAYRNTLGRAPEPTGLAYWTGRLDQGLARWKMIHGFARSPEFVGRERVHVGITLMTWVLEGRTPDALELDGNPRSLRPGSGSIRHVAVDLLAGMA